MKFNLLLESNINGQYHKRKVVRTIEASTISDTTLKFIEIHFHNKVDDYNLGKYSDIKVGQEFYTIEQQ